MAERYVDIRALERAIHGVGSATGFWLLKDPVSGRWLRKRYFVNNVAPGISWEGIHDLWVTEVEAELGLTWRETVPHDRARFLSMVPGDVDDVSTIQWADGDANDYPEVPSDPDIYTVILDLGGERYMSEWDADSWVAAERHVILSLMFGDDYDELDDDAIPSAFPGIDFFLVGATVKGYAGCFEPESLVYTTHDGLSPS